MVPAVLVAAGVTASLIGCTAEAPVVPPSPAPDATEFTPEVTDEGANALASIPGCAEVGEMFSSVIDGLEMTLDSAGDASVFCDWSDPDDENRAFSVEVLASSDPVPSADVLAASGANVVDAAPVADAGGIAYIIATDSSAYSLSVVLPTHSASVTVLNLGSEPERLTILTTGLSTLLGLEED